MQLRTRHYLLFAIIALAIALRLAVTLLHVGNQPMASFLISYVDIADNLRAGNGYVIDGQPPIQYLMPGYPLLAAGIGAVNLLILQNIADGLIAPLLLYLALKGRSGLLAAFLYAAASPLIRELAWFLPDALMALFCVCTVCPILIWRDWRGAVASGAAVGLACWFRGDFLFLIPLLAIALFIIHRNARTLAAFVATSGALVVLLGLFWYSAYGFFSLTRPGIGLLAWEGLHQFDPLAPGEENQDQAAAHLLTANGLSYGTAPADTFLLNRVWRESISNPLRSGALSAWRLTRVLGLDSAVPLLALALIVGLAFAGFALHPGEPITVGMLALATWRIVPFTVLRDESRFVLPLLIVYLVGMAMVLLPRQTLNTAKAGAQ